MYKIKENILATVLLCSTFAMAGGDLAPVEPIETMEAVVVDNSGFYLGLGVSSMALNNDYSSEEFSSTGMMLQAGYQFNEYIALEGRYTVNVGDLKYDHGSTSNPNYSDYPGDFSNLAIYLKPTYAFDAFTVYGLLGYGEVTLTDLPHPSEAGSVDRAEDGFQWGIGAGYNIADNISIFLDYVNIYDDKGFDYRAQNADISSELWTFGLSYRF